MYERTGPLELAFCGLFLALLGLLLFLTAASEYLFSTSVAQEMAAALREVSCNEALERVQELASQGALVHLRGCKISKVQDFTWHEDEGLQSFYEALQDDVPRVVSGTFLAGDIAGWYKCDEVSTGCWATVPNYVEALDQDVAVGAYDLADPVIRGLPSKQLPVRTSPDYAPTSAWCSHEFPDPSSRNMKVEWDGYLYSHYPNFCDGDIRIGFRVGVPGDVSLLAAFDVLDAQRGRRRLVEWRSKSVGTADPVALAALGEASAEKLLEGFAREGAKSFKKLFGSGPFFLFAAPLLQIWWRVRPGVEQGWRLRVVEEDFEDRFARILWASLPTATAILVSAGSTLWLTYWHPLLALPLVALVSVWLVKVFRRVRAKDEEGEDAEGFVPLLAEDPDTDYLLSKVRPWVFQGLVLGTTLGSVTAFLYTLLGLLIDQM